MGYGDLLRGQRAALTSVSDGGIILLGSVVSHQPGHDPCQSALLAEKAGLSVLLLTVSPHRSISVNLLRIIGASHYLLFLLFPAFFFLINLPPQLQVFITLYKGRRVEMN